MMFADEKRGRRLHPLNLLTWFVETVQECGLIDLDFTREKFILEKSRGKSNWVHERLDRRLINQD